MTDIALGRGGEFDRIRAIAVALGDAGRGLGDDAAIIPDAPGTLVTSVDVSVEGVHFRRNWLTLEEIGWRSAASAVSDLAATAATPTGMLAAIIVPRHAPEDQLIQLMRGVGEVARQCGAPVLGGDLTSGTRWAIAITVFGRAQRVLSRRGAKPGDRVWVTGALGGARAALQSWTAAIEPNPMARESFAHPLPRIDEGQALSALGATAMMDLSDGLGGDAEHLAAASGVALRIDLDRLPLHDAVVEAARLIGEEAAVFAANAGEDYELLVTLPAEFDESLFRQRSSTPITMIGEVVEGTGVQALLHGTECVIAGFRHAV